MNILFLSETFYPHGGGAELATYLYAKLLSEAGLEVVVVANKFPGEPRFSKEGSMTVIRLPFLAESSSVKYSMLARPDTLISNFLRKLIKSTDVVYIPRFWYSSILLAKACGKTVITHLHDYFPVCPLSNLHDLCHEDICRNGGLFCQPKCIYTFEKNQSRSFFETLSSIALNMTVGRSLGKLVALSDAIICVSKAQKDLITSHAPHLRPKTHVIYNPLPDIPYLGIAGDDFGYFGGPNRMKGFHILYAALLQVRNERLRIHATKFSETARIHLGQVSSRFLLYDKVAPSLFDKIWEQIRAIVVPSIWQEPLPYVVSEAILRGRIVVASKAGGIPEQLEKLEGNLLCEIGNYKQFGEAIDFVRDLSREEISDIGWRNRDRLLRRFDSKAILKQFTNICENLE